MNACVPTNRSFCSNKKVTAKPRSDEAKARMEFFRTHNFSVKIDRKNDTMKMVVSDK